MFTRYQYHVQWAKSILREQGFDDCSVTRILENYTKPLELPFLQEDGAEQTDNSCNRMGPNTENTELPRQSSTDTGNVVALSPEDQDEGCKEACLEGNPESDPVAVWGSQEQERGDLKEGAEGPCQKHGFPGHCGCKAKGSAQQGPCEMIKSKECAPEYVLVQEEEEDGLCPEDGSAHAQGHVRIKSILIFYKNYIITAIFRIWYFFQFTVLVMQ